MKNINSFFKVLFVVTSILCIVSCDEDTLDSNATGTITGTVVLEGNNEPTGDVKISTNPSSSTVFTAEDGTFVINNVVVGDYAVQADKDEFITSFEQATVQDGVATNVIFELQPQTGDNTPPSIPELIAPIDGSVGVSLSPTFLWSSMDVDAFDDVLYRLELRNDMTNEIEVFENLTDTTLVVQGLAFSTKYFWQVQADDGVNDLVNSALSSFETVESPNNRILYVRKINGNNVIFSTNENGENDLQLTSDTKNSWRPRMIENSERIAFLSNDGTDTQVFTMNQDGSGIVQVTTNPVRGFLLDELDFAFGPSNNIFYPNNNQLLSVDINGGSSSVAFETSDGSLISEVAYSNAADLLAIKTNDVNGYNTSIFTLDFPSLTLVDTIFTGQPGGAGGLDFDIGGTLLLYAFDDSTLMLDNYQLQNSRLFIYNTTDGVSTDVSGDRPAGTNDIDPRFSPNTDKIIFTNVGIGNNATPKVMTKNSESGMGIDRDELKNNASMADWE